MSKEKSGLFWQCDAEGCDFRESVEDLTEEMVDTPCPKCGESLLTLDDYQAFLPFKAMLQGLLKLNQEINPDNEHERVPLSVHHHNGITTISGQET